MSKSLQNASRLSKTSNQVINHRSDLANCQNSNPTSSILDVGFDQAFKLQKLGKKKISKHIRSPWKLCHPSPKSQIAKRRYGKDQTRKETNITKQLWRLLHYIMIYFHGTNSIKPLECSWWDWWIKIFKPTVLNSSSNSTSLSPYIKHPLHTKRILWTEAKILKKI